MIEVKHVNYTTHAKDFRAVRHEVFVEEQQVDKALEFDGLDESCEHWVAYLNEKPIATARLDLNKNGKVGRMAVIKKYRKQGVGLMVMCAIEKHAKENALKRLWFSAQQIAVGFYEKLGYTICSETYIEANVVHVEMEKHL